MSVLNSGLSPANIPSYVRRSFKSGHLQRVELRQGMKLFVVSHKPTIDINGEAPAFWSPFGNFKHDKGFKARAKAAKKLPSGAGQALITDLSAFYGRKPGGAYAIVAKLRVPVVGFMGPIRRQGKSAAQIAAATSSGAASSGSPAAPGSGPNIIGYQIYIPGLQVGRDIIRTHKFSLRNL